jgi:hypothetical protein
MTNAGRVVVVFGFLALSCWAAAPALADDSFLCPKTHKWVSVGDTPARVLELCGQPKSREDASFERCTDDGRHCRRTSAERWVYDFGRTYLVRHLLFIEGTLNRIDLGEYGEAP